MIHTIIVSMVLPPTISPQVTIRERGIPLIASLDGLSLGIYSLVKKTAAMQATSGGLAQVIMAPGQSGLFS